MARNLALAACFAALPLLPERSLSTDEWLGLGLGFALLLSLGLAVAVLALAREVGMLRLRLGPAAALEIPEEGPELGARVDLIDRFERGAESGLALAVFTSEGCHVCRGLEPAIATLAGDPAVAVEIFDEVAEADVWRDLEIPGSPFAIALDPGGAVLAKGTFNNLAQLEGVLATATVVGPALGLGSEMAERDRIGEALDSLAGDSSRRGFLARLGAGLLAATAGGVVAKAVKPGDADAFHFCGHIYTTGSCIHPLGLPRLDARGYPIRPSDGRPVDNLGRLVNEKGQPIHEGGDLKRDPDGLPLPPAPRTKVCDQTADVHGIKATLQGAWYRCCGGRVRKLWDCCSHHDRRINGDAALHGYCYGGRKVFCVTYYQTNVPC